MPKGEATENVSITMPISLLHILDHFCREADLNRSQTVNRAIRLYLGTKISKECSFWEEFYQKLQKGGKI